MTSAEVLQEILHRYAVTDRRDAIPEPAFDAVLGFVDEVFPIDTGAVERASKVLGQRRLSSRDAWHIALNEPARRRANREFSIPVRPSVRYHEAVLTEPSKAPSRRR